MDSTTLEPASGKRTHWWGSGPPPHERWKGVSLTFDPTWSTLRDRWETHEGRFYYDPEKGQRAVDFFPFYLTHHIGDFAGEPFILRDDQDQLIVRPLFGWRNADTGRRRFRKLFGFCPKGYGKSPVGAGLGIYLARFDGENAAEVYAVAADREQARTVHDGAKIMVENSPELHEGAEILKNSIVWPHLYSKYVVLTSDASTKHGFRPHGVIFDELHAQKNRELFEALSKSMAKRTHAMMIIITHAGVDDMGICFEEYELAKRVLSGNANIESTLPVIFEMRKDEEWTDPAVWRRVNPGHGQTVQHEVILEECLEAQAEPRKKNDFVRYHGNRWTNAATAWIPLEWWDACEGVMDDAELVELECAAGLDLAQKWDLACFNVVFRKYLKASGDGGRTIDQLETVVTTVDDTTGEVMKRPIELNYVLYTRPFFWIPEETMAMHAKTDAIPYQEWVDLGLITPTEGSVIDYTRIYSDIVNKIVPRYPRLKQGTIGYDPAMATDISTRLKDPGGLKVIEILQNYRMLSEPSQIVEALIRGGRVVHDGHKVLRSHWENISIKTDDAGRIHPVKPKRRSKRVDGAVSMIMGDKALSLQEPPKEPQFQMFFFGGGPR